MADFVKIFKQYKKDGWAGAHLMYFEELDSTNLEAVRQSAQSAHGTVIVAESQTAGRGRRGRSWVSPAGENLYFSLLLKPEFVPEQAAMLTLVMALATARAIQTVSGCACQIKWPNDIVLHGKKVCGILTEMQVAGGRISHVVIGVGVNANQMVFDTENLRHASSIQKETGRAVEREALLVVLLSEFEKAYEEFCRSGSLETLRQEYESLLVNRGREVRILEPKGAWQGLAMGINEKGELLVQRADGTLEAVYAGEVSVRGLWDYV